MTTRPTGFKSAYALLVFLATGIALYATHYYFTGGSTAPPELRGNIEDRPLAFYAHIGGGALALGLGVWQFLPRTRRSAWHRYAGRLYVGACLVGGIGSLALAPNAYGGPVAQSGFFLLGLLWIGTTLRAWQLIRAGQVAQHRIWIYRSFGLTCAAITLRLILLAGAMLGLPTEPVYVFTAWACWLSSLAIAEVTRRYSDARTGGSEKLSPA